MQFEDFETQLVVLLQSAGPATVAELTDTTIAYWNGERVVYANVDTEGTGRLIGPCALDARRWLEWKDWLGLADRSCSERAARPAPRTVSFRGLQYRCNLQGEAYLQALQPNCSGAPDIRRARAWER
jgi:hypothetical protein